MQGGCSERPRLEMLRVVPIRVVAFLALTACGALCQQSASESLPDAPSAIQASSQVFRASAKGYAAGVGDQAGELRLSRENLFAVYNDEPNQNDSGDFFVKHLYPSLLKRNLSYHPSSSDSLMGRATYAASRIFITQDEGGKGRLNTSYILGVLSSAMVHVAYRPYWNRSATAPFSDFGSTVGNDAGMNVLHEFAPNLQQLVKSHTPKFVSRIEERIGR